MNRTTLAVAALAALALAAPATASAKSHGKHRSTTLRAKVAPAAGTSVRGKARLVDAKRDRVSLQLRGLTAGTQYTWEVRSAPAGGDACNGTAVDGFSLRALRVRRHGNASATGRSKAFSTDAASDYAIVILDADGNVVACASLDGKGSKQGDHSTGGGQSGSGQHSGDTQDDQGDDNQQGDEGSSDSSDDPSGDSSDDPSADGSGDSSGGDDPSGD
jgi:hypothetical protein